MKVSLISHTPNAWELLLGTKSTRMRGQDPATMTDAEKWDHWNYMLDTIRSPFEFVDYVFEVEGVSKNFTHQLVRTRTGAYQQETSRALDMTGNGTIAPDGLTEAQEQLFWDGVADADAHYQQLIAAGVQLQDARAILPSNMETKIKAKFNLRTLSDTAKTRLCARTQGEYQKVFRMMRELVILTHPWADPLLQVHCVATGTCAFPRWASKIVEMEPHQGGLPEPIVTHQCPHYDPRMDLTALKNEVRLKFWSADKIAQANPVAHNGKSM
jgi:flavin-dependent thymidylate synthase